MLIGKRKKHFDQRQWSLYDARLISYYACAPHQGKDSKIKKPTDLFPLDIDKDLKKERTRKLKPIKVISRDEQSNG